MRPSNQREEVIARRVIGVSWAAAFAVAVLFSTFQQVIGYGIPS